MSVFRCYSEKPGFDVEARGLCGQLREQLGIDALEGVRILNRYDADRIAPEVYEAAKTVVFSEPQVDDVYDETFPVPEAPHSVLAVEALPGQFDQRADSCAQCIQLIIPEFLIFCKTFFVACFCQVFFQYCLKVCQFLRIGCSIFIIGI